MGTRVTPTTTTRVQYRNKTYTVPVLSLSLDSATETEDEVAVRAYRAARANISSHYAHSSTNSYYLQSINRRQLKQPQEQALAADKPRENIPRSSLQQDVQEEVQYTRSRSVPPRRNNNQTPPANIGSSTQQQDSSRKTPVKVRVLLTPAKPLRPLRIDRRVTPTKPTNRTRSRSVPPKSRLGAHHTTDSQHQQQSSGVHRKSLDTGTHSSLLLQKVKAEEEWMQQIEQEMDMVHQAVQQVGPMHSITVTTIRAALLPNPSGDYIPSMANLRVPRTALEVKARRHQCCTSDTVPHPEAVSITG